MQSQSKPFSEQTANETDYNTSFLFHKGHECKVRVIHNPDATTTGFICFTEKYDGNSTKQSIDAVMKIDLTSLDRLIKKFWNSGTEQPVHGRDYGEFKITTNYISSIVHKNFRLKMGVTHYQNGTVIGYFGNGVTLDLTDLDRIITFYKDDVTIHESGSKSDTEKTEKKVERILGKNPETGYNVIASMGSYGPMLTMARSEKQSENAFAPIKSSLTIETITLEQALQILKYPKILGVHNKENVVLKSGKHSFYVMLGNMGATIPEDVDPDDITLEHALEYFEPNRVSDNKESDNKEKEDTYDASLDEENYLNLLDQFKEYNTGFPDMEDYSITQIQNIKTFLGNARDTDLLGIYIKAVRATSEWFDDVEQDKESALPDLAHVLKPYVAEISKLNGEIHFGMVSGLDQIFFGVKHAGYWRQAYDEPKVGTLITEGFMVAEHGLSTMRMNSFNCHHAAIIAFCEERESAMKKYVKMVVKVLDELK